MSVDFQKTFISAYIRAYWDKKGIKITQNEEEIFIPYFDLIECIFSDDKKIVIKFFFKNRDWLKFITPNDSLDWISDYFLDQTQKYTLTFRFDSFLDETVKYTLTEEQAQSVLKAINKGTQPNIQYYFGGYVYSKIKRIITPLVTTNPDLSFDNKFLDRNTTEAYCVNSNIYFGGSELINRKLLNNDFYAKNLSRNIDFSPRGYYSVIQKIYADFVTDTESRNSHQANFGNFLINSLENKDETVFSGLENYLAKQQGFDFENIWIKNLYQNLGLEDKFQKTSVSLANKTFMVDEFLPIIEDLPEFKETKLVEFKSKASAFKKILFKKNEKKELLISFYNQVALATANLLFQADKNSQFEEICYNGWINTRDKKTGREIKVCVVSFLVTKKEFFELNLKHVDPIECVKSFSGRVEKDLESVSVEGVKPFLTFEEDKKIIQTDAVIDKMESNNLMDLSWEEFEVLVRDWLRKEFDSAKVEVTQSSRDGGIDAIIYDDDFLRGGVTLVQVKQYNIIVPVSAVRDLYGVMQDRRASKGILVTTSDFGSDSRQFVKDKPISLVNGTNLLYYLNKHGYNAEIRKTKNF